MITTLSIMVREEQLGCRVPTWWSTIVSRLGAKQTSCLYYAGQGWWLLERLMVQRALWWESISLKPIVRNWTGTRNEIRYEQNWLILFLLEECEYYHELMKWRSWVDNCNLWTKQRCCGEVSGRRKVSVVKDGSREKPVGWAVHVYMWHRSIQYSLYLDYQFQPSP